MLLLGYASCPPTGVLSQAGPCPVSRSLPAAEPTGLALSLMPEPDAASKCFIQLPPALAHGMAVAWGDPQCPVPS